MFHSEDSGEHVAVTGQRQGRVVRILRDLNSIQHQSRPSTQRPIMKANLESKILQLRRLESYLVHR